MGGLDEEKIKQVRLMYPDRIPTLVVPEGFNLKERKFLFFKDESIYKVNAKIRGEYEMKSHEAMFLFVGNILLSQVDMLSQYDKGGLVVIHMMKENSFGCKL